MHTYREYVFADKLVSPVNEHTCRRITRQNIKFFGFDDIDDLHRHFPNFPLRCPDLDKVYRAASKKGGDKIGQLQAQQARERRKNKVCLVCKSPLTDRNKIKFCSRSCSVTYQNRGKNRSFLYQERYDKNPVLCTKCGDKITYQCRYYTLCHGCLSSPPPKLEVKSKKITSLKRVKKPRYCSCGSLLQLWARKCESCIKTKKRKRKTVVKTCQCSAQLSSHNHTYCGKCKTNISHYRSLCAFKFNIYNFPNDFDLTLVEQHGWYSPNGAYGRNKSPNLDGVSRDHLYTVMDGFHAGRDPNMLAHPANCRVMTHNGPNGNNSKNRTSSITWEELLSRIAEWDATH